MTLKLAVSRSRPPVPYGANLLWVKCHSRHPLAWPRPDFIHHCASCCWLFNTNTSPVASLVQESCILWLCWSKSLNDVFTILRGIVFICVGVGWRLWRGSLRRVGSL